MCIKEWERTWKDAEYQSWSKLRQDIMDIERMRMNRAIKDAMLEKLIMEGEPKPGVLGASPKTSSVRKLQEKLTAILRRIVG